MVAPIVFHFDYISPYAYLAWTQLAALAQRTGRSVEPVPTLFAALLNAHGQKGPGEIPAKRIWVWKDTLRTARHLGVPLSPPPSHPFNPLLALRVTSLADDRDTRARLVDAMYAATWGGGDGIETAEQVTRVLDGIGLDGVAWIRRAGEPAAKARLRAATEEAVAAGVFGVPTMRVGDELFWGFDSFAHLERHLRGEDSFSAQDLLAWTHVKPSAERQPR
jgi:2-hydroxychromene-2-carboxylate isomerase